MENKKSLDEIFSDTSDTENNGSVTQNSGGKSLDEIFSDSPTIKQPAPTIGEFMENTALPIGLVGGGALALGKGVQVLARPFLQSAKLSREASPMRNALGLEKNTAVSDLPGFISQKKAAFDIDTKLIADNMAKTLKSNLKGWKDSNYENWSKEISAIDSELSGKGLNFSTKNFNDMLSKTASYLESQGDEKGAEALRKAIVKKGKEGFLKQQLDFDDASKRISNLRSKVPSAKNALRENWMEFLKNDPIMSQVPLTQERITNLYNNYVPFKQTVNTIESLSPQKFGEFKTSSLSRFLQSAIESKSQDALRTLDYLSKGSSTINPMEGASEALARLQQLVSERTQFDQFLSKANEMAMRQQGINRAINRRALGLNIAGAGTVAGRLGNIAKGTMLGVYPAVGGLSGLQEMLQNKGEFPEQISDITNKLFPGAFPTIRKARPEDLQT